jgi:hypothetical protein
MGLAYNVTMDSGLMGIGYDTNEASLNPETKPAPFEYPSIIDSMVSQGLIPSKAYSLYLNDLEASTGSIIFGGLDSDKYHGSLVQMPIIPSTLRNGSTLYYNFAVALTGFSMTGQAGNVTQFTIPTSQEAAILDSGTTITYLPDRIVHEIVTLLNAYVDNTGILYVDCNILTQSPKMTFNYEFGGRTGVNISIPISELVFPLTGAFSTNGSATPDVPFASPCALGISGSGGESNTLGDTFLRSAYVVYDLSNNLIAIAQTNFNSTTSSIVEFQASATGIPIVSGVAMGVTGVTETATGPLGVGTKTTTTGSSAATTGTVKTTTGTVEATTGAVKTTTTLGAGSAGSSTTTTKSASTSATTSATSGAVGPVPAFDVRGLMVLGISSIFALLGGSWLLV